MKEVSYGFLYQNDDVFHFSHPTTFDEIEVPRSKILANAIPFLESGSKVRVRFYEDDVVLVSLQSKNIQCTIKEIISMGENNSKGC